MPVSREIAVASSSMRAAMPSPMRFIYLARSCTSRAAQPMNAARAACAAASTSLALHDGIDAMTSSLVESKTSIALSVP